MPTACRFTTKPQAVLISDAFQTLREKVFGAMGYLLGVVGVQSMSLDT